MNPKLKGHSLFLKTIRKVYECEHFLKNGYLRDQPCGSKMGRDFGVLNGEIDYKQLYSNYLFKYKRLRILVSKNP